MQTFRAYFQESDGQRAENLPTVQAEGEQTAAFIAATRWLTAQLHQGQSLDGVVITLAGNRVRVMLDSGRVLDFYATE
jgi:hypothetical protein